MTMAEALIILWHLIVVYAGLMAVFFVVSMVCFRDDIKAVFERDPAAANIFEVVLTYSGFHAIVWHRFAHFLRKLKMPFLPRFISQAAKFFTGIEIHPGAEIGKGFFIDHGMGVVIGETTIIGDNVTLFQGVTLGGTGKEKGKRHPTIGNNVVMGTGAKILGNIKVGDNVSIGANAVVLRGVPDNSTVVGVPGRIARREGVKMMGINIDYTMLPDPLTKSLDSLQHEIDKIESAIKEWHHKDK